MFEKVKALCAKFGGYWQGLLHDINIKPSSKRLTLVIAVVLIIVAFLANLIYRIFVDPHILDAIKWLGSIAGGGVAAEHVGNAVSKIAGSAKVDNPDGG